ncbi:DUF6551 family protein [Streptomyces sp. NBC_00162]|uniref:DUF6551 family protein n=1 Tax=Streptomyces sp. NBC_00162 TaxID=2903629 RepID=UPI00214BEBA8|nr:DUF6551 family protein [Streptomyces sp. NBC_00162]UUU38443.1 hypothetical protein JIW86_06100 [Streptomyces sp. NBC_00162]
MTKTAPAKKAVGKQRGKDEPQYEPVPVDPRSVFHQKIPVGLLEVDPSLDAQRMFQRSWANKLGKKWNPRLLLPAIVSKRADGRYYLLDGQHSTQVALEKHGPEFERHCLVYEELADAEEAALFLAANRDRKAVKPVDNYRVALTAGEPLVTRVDAEVVSCGLTVTGSSSPNQVGAVQAVLLIGEKRVGLLPKVLTTLAEAWGRDATSWDNMMIRAVGMVIHTNWKKEDDAPRIDLDRLALVLRKRTVRQWKTDAIRSTQSGGGSQSRSQPLAENVVTAYNIGITEPTELVIAPGRGAGA